MNQIARAESFFQSINHRSIIGGFLLLAIIFQFNCALKKQNTIKVSGDAPPIILWAWERAEDLRFLDTKRYGAAFLAETLYLQNDDVIFRPRRQKLELPDGIYLIAVTRIETSKDQANRPTLSENQINQAVDLVKKSLALPDVKAIQIDFDVVLSERNFYRKFINQLKNNLPENTPLTMTALASWCVGDVWFNDFPVDEAVPMAFEMGADTTQVRSFLASGQDWREPLCRGSYGFSVDEPLAAKLQPQRRIYYFKSKAWEKSDLEKLPVQPN